MIFRPTKIIFRPTGNRRLLGVWAARGPPTNVGNVGGFAPLFSKSSPAAWGRPGPPNKFRWPVTHPCHPPTNPPTHQPTNHPCHPPTNPPFLPAPPTRPPTPPTPHSCKRGSLQPSLLCFGEPWPGVWGNPRAEALYLADIKINLS